MNIRYGLLGIFLVSSMWGGARASNESQDTLQNVEQAQLEAVALALQQEQDANVQKDKKQTMLIAAAVSAGIIALAIVSYWLKTRGRPMPAGTSSNVGQPPAYTPPTYAPNQPSAPFLPGLPSRDYVADVLSDTEEDPASL
jgi:hypothetical protein